MKRKLRLEELNCVTGGEGTLEEGVWNESLSRVKDEKNGRKDIPGGNEGILGQ